VDGSHLVIGCDGRIGSLIYNTLKQRGEKVMGLLGGPAAFVKWEPAPEIVYLCAGNADPSAAFQEHLETVELAAHVLKWCASAGVKTVKTVYLCGSSWADPITDGREQTANTFAYGAAKRAVREMVAAYPRSAKCIRLGWYPAKPCPDVAPEWLKREYWTESDVLRAFDLSPDRE